MMGYYGVPLLFTADSGFVTMNTEDQVLAAVRQQVEEMRAAGYDHTEILSSDVTVLNSTSALYQWTVSRRQHDGSEVSRLTFTELLTDSPSGRRISLIALESH